MLPFELEDLGAMLTKRRRRQLSDLVEEESSNFRGHKSLFRSRRLDLLVEDPFDKNNEVLLVKLGYHGLTSWLSYFFQK